MKIGIVSDIHGNARALERALDLMGDTDEVFSLGDNINQYRFSNEVVRLLRNRGVHTIVGNHEEVFYSPASARARKHDWIERDALDWLASRPARLNLNFYGKRVLLVHSTPWTPGGEYVVPESRDFARFGETDADIVFYGHTHRPVAVRVNGVLVVNPGSAGEAGVGEDAAILNCAVIDLASEEVCNIRFAT